MDKNKLFLKNVKDSIGNLKYVIKGDTYGGYTDHVRNVLVDIITQHSDIINMKEEYNDVPVLEFLLNRIYDLGEVSNREIHEITMGIFEDDLLPLMKKLERKLQKKLG